MTEQDQASRDEDNRMCMEEIKQLAGEIQEKVDYFVAEEVFNPTFDIHEVSHSWGEVEELALKMRDLINVLEQSAFAGER